MVLSLAVWGGVEFKGRCSIGNNSAISVGKSGTVVFGDGFCATSSFRLTSYHSIEFGERVSFGWDCLVMDTDFHKMTKIEGGYNKGYGKMRIGNNNWFGTGALVMKNTETPDYCVVMARSVLNKKYDFPPYSVIGPATEMAVKRQGMWRNIDDDKIDYSK